jgi:hypothetical protein
VAVGGAGALSLSLTLLGVSRLGEFEIMAVRLSGTGLVVGGLAAVLAYLDLVDLNGWYDPPARAVSSSFCASSSIAAISSASVLLSSTTVVYCIRAHFGGGCSGGGDGSGPL